MKERTFQAKRTTAQWHTSRPGETAIKQLSESGEEGKKKKKKRKKSKRKGKKKRIL